MDIKYGYSKVKYAGNGVTSDFAVPFSYLNKLDVQHSVFVTSTRENVSPAYTFTWINANTVHFTPTPPIGVEVWLERDSSFRGQLVEYANSTSLTARDLETGYLQSWYVAQEALDEAGLRTGNAGSLDTLVAQAQAAASAAAASAVSSAGSATSSSTSAGNSATSAAAAAASAAAAAASAASAAAGVGAFGLLKANNLSDLVSAAVARTNLGLGSMALNSNVQYEFGRVINVKETGADSTGTTDSYTAIMNAIAAAQAIGAGSRVYFPRGTFRFDTPILITGTPVRLIGEGGTSFSYGYITDSFNTILKYNGAATSSAAVTFKFLGTSHGVEGLAIDGNNLADRGLVVDSCMMGAYRDFSVYGGKKYAMVLTTTSGGSACAWNEVRNAKLYVSGVSAKAALYLSGWSNTNTCHNVFNNTKIEHSDGNGIDLGYCDNNKFDLTYISRGSGTGAGVRVLDKDYLTPITITRSGSTATATMLPAQPFSVGASFAISGATQPEYNGTFTVTAVTATTFSFTVSGTPASPATGAPVTGFGGFPCSNTFWHLEAGNGGWVQDATQAGWNTVYHYDRVNGQPVPVVPTGSKLVWSDNWGTFNSIIAGTAGALGGADLRTVLQVANGSGGSFAALTIGYQGGGQSFYDANTHHFRDSAQANDVVIQSGVVTVPVKVLSPYVVANSAGVLGAKTFSAVAVGATVTFTNPGSGLFVARHLTSGSMALFMVDTGLTMTTIISDPNSAFSTTDPGAGGNKWVVFTSGGNVSFINRFTAAKDLAVACVSFFGTPS
jgi:hypothetical protein